jgi:hypothetical protein
MQKHESPSPNKHIATVRFTNKTWEENGRFRQERMKLNGCIYPVSAINSTISQNAIIYVLEMNNDTNKLMGIGIVRNKPIYKKYRVYENDEYNTFSYVGKVRIDRNELDEEEEIALLEKLEGICFKGKGHLKRLKGIKILSQKNIDRISTNVNVTIPTILNSIECLVEQKNKHLS